MRHYDLTPLFRSGIGFDRLSNVLDAALRGEENAPSYPPYNIEKHSDDRYRIVIAVAGFKREELNITVKDQTLSVAGRTQEAEGETPPEFLHKGIATRAFERKFSLADHVKVLSADMRDGLLLIDLERQIPEESKPRMIEIGTGVTIDGKKAH
jgi:molecular chaperone IbpA